MRVRIWRFVTLVLVALNMGAAFAHVLELPGKLRLSGSEYLKTQQIYRAFGPVGALLEPGSVLAAAGLTALVRGRPAFGPSLAGTGALAAALAAWLVLVAPMNARFARWPKEGIPVDWTRTRDRWEYAHAGRFVLQLLGFGALLASALAETPGGRGQ